VDIIVVSGKANKTINFQIRSVLLAVGFLFMITLLIVFTYNVIKFATTDFNQSRIIQLKEENKIIHDELTRIEKEMYNLGGLIDSLELYDKKLRTYASLEPISEDVRKMGVGGYTRDYGTDKLSSRTSENLDDISQTLDNLLARAQLQKESFDAILTYLEEKTYLQNHTPSIIPVQGWLMRGYGYHTDPFTQKVKMHEGLDIAAPIGTPIVAPSDGTVKFTGEKSGYGLMLEIDHGYGFSTIYAHCQRIKVNQGDKVARGDTIAYVGNTGKSTGPHLHYEVHVSQTPANPIDYIITATSVID
jgi:murein DD-endopeptidase MepM/ murein hydrolase activator NlpD